MFFSQSVLFNLKICVVGGCFRARVASFPMCVRSYLKFGLLSDMLYLWLVLFAGSFFISG